MDQISSVIQTNSAMAEESAASSEGTFKSSRNHEKSGTKISTKKALKNECRWSLTAPIKAFGFT